MLIVVMHNKQSDANCAHSECSSLFHAEITVCECTHFEGDPKILKKETWGWLEIT